MCTQYTLSVPKHDLGLEISPPTPPLPIAIDGLSKDDLVL